MHLTTHEHVGERVAHELADTQLALRGRVGPGGIVLASSGHDRPEFCPA
jgi:hypothetical protein